MPPTVDFHTAYTYGHRRKYICTGSAIFTDYHYSLMVWEMQLKYTVEMICLPKGICQKIFILFSQNLFAFLIRYAIIFSDRISLNSMQRRRQDITISGCHIISLVHLCMGRAVLLFRDSNKKEGEVIMSTKSSIGNTGIYDASELAMAGCSYWVCSICSQCSEQPFWYLHLQV